MDERDRAAVARGLASVAVATAERGGSEADARLALIRVLRAHGTADPALVRDAAALVVDLAQPPTLDDETPEDRAATRDLRPALGVPEPVEQLAAALRGREWLQRFAADLAR